MRAEETSKRALGGCSVGGGVVFGFPDPKGLGVSLFGSFDLFGLLGRGIREGKGVW